MKKKGLVAVVLVIVLSLAALSLTACGGAQGSGASGNVSYVNGTYYPYVNGVIDKSGEVIAILTLNNGKWIVDNVETGDYTVSGTNITLYIEEMGRKQEFASGTIDIDNGKLTLNIAGIEVVFARETPQSGGGTGSIPGGIEDKDPWGDSEDRDWENGEGTISVEYVYNSLTGTCMVDVGHAQHEKTIIIEKTYKGYPVTAIADNAFVNCEVERILIPESIVSIGTNAFAGCSHLQTVRWDAINCISGSFAGCTSISTVRIGENVVSIPAYAFKGCNKLKSIEIPSSVIAIGAGAFEDCSNLTKVNYEGGSILRWCGIDFGADSYGFNSEHANPLCNGADFYIDRVKQNTIEIPQTITDIKAYTFEGFKNITKVNIHRQINSIGKGAFQGCESLTSINIPSRVELDDVISIGENAFYGCSGLTDITMSYSVTAIGGGAFAKCNNLKTVNYTGTLAAWCKIDFKGAGANPLNNGADLFINNDKLATLTIPPEITEIKQYVFEGCNIKSIDMHEDFVSIGNYAFSGCSGLTSITIPANLTSIGNGVFSGCKKLKTVTFDGDSRLKSIGDNAFSGCKKLVEINIAEGVTSIGSRAFEDCTTLQTVNWNATNCTEAGLLSDPIFNGCKSLAIVNIGANVEIIPAYAFANCSKLTEITIPTNVTSIGNCAFRNCTTLQTVNWNATNCAKAGLLSDPIFNGCKSLAIVNIGANVETIPAYAFANCSGLTEITIPANVTSIGGSAFSGCGSLTSITLPFVGDKLHNAQYPFGYIFGESSYEGGTVTRQSYNGSESTYYIPRSLKTVIITGSSYIPHHAFHNCNNITSITIPTSVTSIDKYAFLNCTNLQTVTFDGDSQLKSIGDNAFLNCRNLQTVTFDGDSRLESIGDRAFEDCSNFTSITIPTSVTSIGNRAFYGCTNLQTVTFAPDSRLRSISANTFSGCKRLVEINIPEYVTSIGDRAFEDCSNLTSITIPSSVTSISSRAFYKCTKLQTAAFASTNVWEVSERSDMMGYPTTLSSEDLQNPSIAAYYLKSTYCDYYWKRTWA